MRTQQTLIKPSSTAVAADLFTLKSHEIASYEEVIRALLSRIENPDWTSDEVVDDLKSARAQCWGIANTEIKGVWITKILANAKAKYGLVWIAAGDGLSFGLSRFLECTEPWFAEMGCEYIEVQGRKGWEKVLPGFEFHSVTLRKKLWAAADHHQIRRAHSEQNPLTT